MATPENGISEIGQAYWQEEPSQTISLGKVQVEFTVGDELEKTLANVHLRFAPEDRLCLDLSPKDVQPLSYLKAFTERSREGKLRLVERNVTIDVIWTGIDDFVHFTPCSSVITVTPNVDGIAEAVFHLFNFPEFFASADKDRPASNGTDAVSRVCQTVVLRADGWIVTITAAARTHAACAALKRSGGFIITHAGKITREQGHPFSTSQLSDLLRCLHAFLSFCLGRWAGVALPIGFGKCGAKVFEQWGLPMVSSGAWNCSLSWFDPLDADNLSRLFPGFVSRWYDRLWSVPFWKALYWYVCANIRSSDIGIDAGLILAQAAFEQLAWTYCVVERRMISKDAFGERGVSAADKLRLLLCALNIPTDIPKTLRALSAKRGQQWQDGPDAITCVRNSVVHSHHKQGKLPPGCECDAWQLAMWFLDLVFLRLCNYQGEYANRLPPHGWKGQSELVPWARSKN